MDRSSSVNPLGVFKSIGTEKLRTAIFQRLRAVDGLIEGGGELSHRLAQLVEPSNCKPHRLGCRGGIADVAFHRLRNCNVLLQLLQLLVERGDGFGPLGDLLRLRCDGDGIGDDRDRILGSGQRREADEEN